MGTSGLLCLLWYFALLLKKGTLIFFFVLHEKLRDWLSELSSALLGEASPGVTDIVVDNNATSESLNDLCKPAETGVALTATRSRVSG